MKKKKKYYRRHLVCIGYYFFIIIVCLRAYDFLKTTQKILNNNPFLDGYRGFVVVKFDNNTVVIEEEDYGMTGSEIIRANSNNNNNSMSFPEDTKNNGSSSSSFSSNNLTIMRQQRIKTTSNNSTTTNNNNIFLDGDSGRGKADERTVTTNQRNTTIATNTPINANKPIVANFAGRPSSSNPNKKKLLSKVEREEMNRRKEARFAALKLKAQQQPPVKKKKKVLSNFLLHIPKTGGEYAFAAIQKILQQHFEKQKRIPSSKYYRACNQAKEPLTNFVSTYRSDYNGVRCTMWMSEDRYNSTIFLQQQSSSVHTYTILRDPHEHVLSQYFHCSESKDRVGTDRQLTINLNEWLQNWISILQQRNKPPKKRYDPLVNTKPAQNYIRKTHNCYNPTNLQSYMLNFDSSIEDNNKADLKSKFDVIGDNSQMTLSVCMILIKYMNDVPTACNCTGMVVEQQQQKQPHINDRRTATTSTTTNVTNSIISSSSGSYNTSSQAQQPSTKQQQKVLFDHGVQHHGSTFETTRLQNEMISKLTQYDMTLYKWGQQILKEQVSEVESMYGPNLQICNDQFNI